MISRGQVTKSMSSRGMWTVTSRRREIMRDNDDYMARNHARVVQRPRAPVMYP